MQYGPLLFWFHSLCWRVLVIFQSSLIAKVLFLVLRGGVQRIDRLKNWSATARADRRQEAASSKPPGREWTSLSPQIIIYNWTYTRSWGLAHKLEGGSDLSKLPVIDHADWAPADIKAPEAAREHRHRRIGEGIAHCFVFTEVWK